MKLSNSLCNFAGKAKFTLKKHGPEIYLVSGLVLGATTVGLAAYAAIKSKPEIDKLAERREEIKTSEIPEGTSEKKLIAKEYGKTALKVAKNCAPAIATGALSITCILVSHRILRQRYIAATAAYATLESMFSRYRSNVIERFGKETDLDMRYDIKRETVKETTKDENGKKKTETKEVVTSNFAQSGHSDYAVIFDQFNSDCWTRNRLNNIKFLRSQQDSANETLKRQGYFFLNDMRKLLGMDPVPEGQIVGWTYTKDPEEGRDGQIMLSIFNPRYQHLPEVQDFISGRTESCWIDFNVEGDTWKMLNSI